jgi:NADP-dependent 3-hydroxy acid dehydrogenase YdfG
MARLPAPEVIVIAGASAGVGCATARAFGRPGVRIGLIARRRAVAAAATVAVAGAWTARR